MRMLWKGKLVVGASLFLLVWAAATAYSSNGSTEEQELAQILQQLQQQLAALAETAGQLKSRVSEMEGFVSQLVLDPGRLGTSRAQFLPNPPPGMVTVQFIADDVNDEIPGKFRFHFPVPETERLFTTVSVPAGQPVPRGDEVVDGIVFVEPGKFYTLQVVYENLTDEVVDFLVVAPTLDPQPALPLVRARCMCAAVPFAAPAGGAWYRTIQVGVAPNTPPGAKAIVVWPVVRLNSQGG
ncbi:MAG: hypothetical protein ACE5JP_09120 [Candidatus Bipolaricaulia bacterium]